MIKLKDIKHSADGVVELEFSNKTPKKTLTKSMLDLSLPPGNSELSENHKIETLHYKKDIALYIRRNGFGFDFPNSKPKEVRYKHNKDANIIDIFKETIPDENIDSRFYKQLTIYFKGRSGFKLSNATINKCMFISEIRLPDLQYAVLNSTCIKHLILNTYCLKGFKKKSIVLDNNSRIKTVELSIDENSASNVSCIEFRSLDKRSGITNLIIKDISTSNSRQVDQKRQLYILVMDEAVKNILNLSKYAHIIKIAKSEIKNKIITN